MIIRTTLFVSRLTRGADSGKIDLLPANRPQLGCRHYIHWGREATIQSAPKILGSISVILGFRSEIMTSYIISTNAPMKVESADRLTDLLIKSGLVKRQRYETWRSERSRRSISRASDLAELIVADGLVTRWQADKLLAGKWKGFRLDRYVITGFVRVDDHKRVSYFSAEDFETGRHVILEVMPRSSGLQTDGLPWYTVLD